MIELNELFYEFLIVDTGIAQLMRAKGEIDDLPPPLDDYTFQLDETVKEGDIIDQRRLLEMG